MVVKGRGERRGDGEERRGEEREKSDYTFLYSSRTAVKAKKNTLTIKTTTYIKQVFPQVYKIRTKVYRAL